MSENNIIFNTGVKFPSLIIPTGSQPLDSRTIVQNLPTRADEFTEGAVYIGMTVSCLNDKNFYMLEKIENGNLSWKQVGKKTDLSNYDTSSQVSNKISTAINDLDVTDNAVAGKYVSAVSETDGKITVTRADLPTLSSLGGITPSAVDTKISTTISGLDATVTGNPITIFTYNGKVASNYLSTPQIVETDGKLTSFTVLAPGTNLVTKEYVDYMHQVLLGDNNLKDTVDTITEISYWLDKNPNDAVNLTLSLVELTEKVNDNEKIVATAINNINDMFNSYATIAYVNNKHNAAIAYVNDKATEAFNRSVNYTNTYVSSRLSWDVI